MNTDTKNGGQWWANRLLLVLALVPGLTFYWQNRDIPHFGAQQDDAVYMDSARSLAAGGGYRLTFLPDHPYQVKYPPLYPGLLALMLRVNPDFPSNLGMIVGWNMLMLVAIVLAVHRLQLRFGLGEGPAIWLTIFVVTVPYYVYLGVSVMTEFTFMPLFLWAFLLLEEETVGWVLAAGLLAALSYMTRTASGPMFLTVPLVFAYRRKFKLALAFVCAAAPIPVLWALWQAAHRAPMNDWVSRFYLDYWAMESNTVGWDNLGLVVWRNVDSICMAIGDIMTFSRGRDNEFFHQVARLIGIGTLVGSVRLARRGKMWQYPAFAAVYTALMVFWHFPPDERLFFILLPFFAAGLWTELSNLWMVARNAAVSGKPGDRPVALAFQGAIAVLALFMVYSSAEARLIELPKMIENSRADNTHLRQTFRRVAETTPPDAVIQADQDVMLHLFSGRAAYRTIIPPRYFYPFRFDLASEEFVKLPDARHRPWDYVLVTSKDWRHTINAEDQAMVAKRIAARPDLSLVWQGPTEALYVRKPRVVAGVQAPH